MVSRSTPQILNICSMRGHGPQLGFPDLTDRTACIRGFQIVCDHDDVYVHSFSMSQILVRFKGLTLCFILPKVETSVSFSLGKGGSCQSREQTVRSSTDREFIQEQNCNGNIANCVYSRRLKRSEVVKGKMGRITDEVCFCFVLFLMITVGYEGQQQG